MIIQLLEPNDTNMQMFEESGQTGEEVDQLTIYKRSQGVEPGTTWNKYSWPRLFKMWIWLCY